MSRLLAISDIHGCYDEFIELLEKIKLTRNDELVILGDLVDRGNQNMNVILKIQELKQEGYNIITLKGNHEDLLLYGMKMYKDKEVLYKSQDFDYLLRNGTTVSLVEYYSLSKEKKSMVLKELITQPHFYKKDNFLFVHAGIMPNVKIEDQILDDLLWVREEFINISHNQTYVIIFGHTPTPYLNPNKEFKIWRGPDKIGIDCGCVFGGKLACLDLTNNVEYYVNSFEDK